MTRIGPQPPGIDAVVEAVNSTWALLTSSLDGGWSRTYGRAFAVMTGVAVATFNGVFVTDLETVPEDVEAGLAAVAERELPHCIQLRPDVDPEILRVAARAGLEPAGAMPLMAVTGPVAAAATPELVIRELAPGESAIHTAIAAPVFGILAEIFGPIMTAGLARSEATGYVGEVDGEPVSTAFSITVGDAVGIFNVATLPDHRRRGYGAAMTARALGGGLERGGTWAWLHSSAAGYGVYDALGFTTLERWQLWATPAP